MAINQKWWQATIKNLGMWSGINGWFETVIPYDEINKPENKEFEYLAAFKRNPAYQSNFQPETLRNLNISTRFPPIEPESVNGQPARAFQIPEENFSESYRQFISLRDPNNDTAAGGGGWWSNPLFPGFWRGNNTTTGWKTVYNGWNWWPVVQHSFIPNNGQMYYQGFLANTMAYYTGYYQEWRGGLTSWFRRDFSSRTQKVVKTLNWKMNNKGEIYPARSTSISATGVDKPELSQYGDIGIWPQLVWGELPRAEGIRPDQYDGSDERARHYPFDALVDNDQVLVQRTYQHINESQQINRIQFETYQEIFGSQALIREVDWYQWLICYAANISMFIKPNYKQPYFEAICEWMNSNHNLNLTTRQIKKIISLNHPRINYNVSSEGWCLGKPHGHHLSVFQADNRNMKEAITPYNRAMQDIYPPPQIPGYNPEEDTEIIFNEEEIQSWVRETLRGASGQEGNFLRFVAAANQFKTVLPSVKFETDEGNLIQVRDCTMAEWKALYWDRLQTGIIPSNISVRIYQKERGNNLISLNSRIRMAQAFLRPVIQTDGETEYVKLTLFSEPMPITDNKHNIQHKNVTRLQTNNLITPNQWGDENWWASFLGESGFLKYSDSDIWRSYNTLDEAWPRMMATAAQEGDLSIPDWLANTTAREAWEKVYQGQSITISVTDLSRTLTQNLQAKIRDTFDSPEFIAWIDTYASPDSEIITVPEKLGQKQSKLFLTPDRVGGEGLERTLNMLWTDDISTLNTEYNQAVSSYYRSSDSEIDSVGTISNYSTITRADRRRRTQNIINSVFTNYGWDAVTGGPDNFAADEEWQAIAEENQEIYDDEVASQEFFVFNLPQSWNFPVNRNLASPNRPQFGFIINWSRILSYRIKSLLNPEN